MVGSRSTALALAPGMTTTLTAPNRALEIAQLLAIGLGAMGWCLGLFPIVWFSIWMGLSSKKINIAMVKTFCYAKVLPWFGVSFAVIFLMLLTLRFTGNLAIYLCAMEPSLLFICVNVALIAFARRRARTAFAKWPDLTAA